MNPAMGDIVILSDFVKDPLQRCCMSEDCCVVVDGDTVGDLTEEDDKLLLPFGEEVIPL